MKILTIGNSFSQDATRYLHQIARADGVKLEVANLYIGGCDLARHYRNMLSGERVYELQYNGQCTGFSVSMEEALLNRDWDVVTLQQASHYSFLPETYQPYAEALADYVRQCVPKAKIIVHQTWAYEDGSDRLYNMAGFDTAKAMFAGAEKAYAELVRQIDADGLIPAGRMLLELLDLGIEKVHRDTFHASFGLGRYALGLLWYRVLTGNPVVENTFDDFDEPVTEEQIRVVKDYVGKVDPL